MGRVAARHLSRCAATAPRLLALLLTIVVLLPLGGCPGSSLPLPPGPAQSVTINGRVVDFETCLSGAGCQAADHLRVSLLADSKVVSEATGRDGAFALAGVPRDTRQHLIVSDASGTPRYLPTLQAEAVDSGNEDHYGVELFAVQLEGGLYRAVVDEAQLNIETDGLYLGQVVAIAEGRMEAIEGVTPRATPAVQATRFIRDNPRFNPGEAALFDDTRATTGVFGQFLLVTPAATQTYDIATAAPGYSATALSTPLGGGHLTVGVHRVTPEAAP